MPTESVEILIQADDKASAKLEKVGRSAEKQAKVFREAGGKAKASTELVGTLANTIGGANTELGSFAGQLAQVTERISAFSEVSKAGGAGALAFKAGLAGVVAVLSFKVGQAIGNVIFQTEKWKKEIEAATKAAEKLNAAVLAATSARFQDQTEQIDLIRDPDAQRAELQKLLEQIDKDVQGKKAQIASLNAFIIPGNVSAINKAAQVDLAEAEKAKDVLVQQSLELRKRLSVERELIALKKEENDKLDRSEAFVQSLREQVELLKATKEESQQIEANKNTFGGGDNQAALALIQERDALMAAAEAQRIKEQEDKAARDQKIADEQRIADLRENEIQKLQQQAIELLHGKEAAQAFALEMQGLDKATAAEIAKQQALLDTAKENEKDKLAGSKEVSNNLTAKEGRLLTRGSTDDPSLKIADNTAKMVKKQEASIVQLEAIARNLDRSPVQNQISVVGA